MEAWRATLVWGDDSGWRRPGGLRWSGVMIQAGGGLGATLVWGDDSGWSGVMIQAGLGGDG